MDEVTLPTGEKLPGYDDEPPVDAHALDEWLVEHLPTRWGPGSLPRSGNGSSPRPEVLERVGEYERQIISDVIGALLTVGDATIVKNGTYRALERDRRAVETLGAGLARLGLNAQVLEADGDAVKAALQALSDLLWAVKEVTR